MATRNLYLLALGRDFLFEGSFESFLVRRAPGAPVESIAARSGGRKSYWIYAMRAEIIYRRLILFQPPAHELSVTLFFKKSTPSGGNLYSNCLPQWDGDGPVCTRTGLGSRLNLYPNLAGTRGKFVLKFASRGTKSSPRIGRKSTRF